jgi:hypothetical protein
MKFQTIWKSVGSGSFFGSKGVCYVRQLKVHVIFCQFSVLSVFLLSLLSLAFVLGSDIKKFKESITIFMYSDKILWQKKRRIQNERWYQRERNKEISILKKETKSLWHILGEMQQELDVLTALVPSNLQKERSKNAAMTIDKRAATFIQSCWQEKNSKCFKKMLKLFPLSLLMIRGRIILKREGMIQSGQ